MSSCPFKTNVVKLILALAVFILVFIFVLIFIVTVFIMLLLLKCDISPSNETVVNRLYPHSFLHCIHLIIVGVD